MRRRGRPQPSREYSNNALTSPPTGGAGARVRLKVKPGHRGWRSSLGQGLTEVQPHDRHPEERGQKGKVEGEAKGDTQHVDGLDALTGGEDEHDQDCWEGNADDVANNNFPVEILEVRDNTVDNEGNEKTDEA